MMMGTLYLCGDAPSITHTPLQVLIIPLLGTSQTHLRLDRHGERFRIMKKDLCYRNHFSESFRSCPFFCGMRQWGSDERDEKRDNTTHHP
jgi:hypothetical protein